MREHLDTVEVAGCDEVQGFYFSHPVPSSEVAKVLALCRLKCIAVTPLSLTPQPQPRRQFRHHRAR